MKFRAIGIADMGLADDGTWKQHGLGAANLVRKLQDLCPTGIVPSTPDPLQGMLIS